MNGPARRRVRMSRVKLEWARLGRRWSSSVASKATAVEELLDITEPRSEKTEGIVWEEV